MLAMHLIDVSDPALFNFHLFSSGHLKQQCAAKRLTTGSLAEDGGQRKGLDFLSICILCSRYSHHG